ncbi:bifunctional diguanylate cyclase/phosphodiesterase [Varunaivibrio sulfuroxidans]|uniref:PAS domain S-box-containing protein/diguanylate cyclase (GGDEF)-like protein n=1 Tax=Varunaivibrio sulfuroxidans TaxID=1773489 RepID=A0A4R3JG34_9PROT|nr:EAL domain-containing protein [Varunaivibrio sulfuroxidans]TCS65108.1 PAS domain S-box-containing protein/diguanylate cyclase (GGDEF)-like protein [Varunaivibrio sulfuroxidans]WES29605.1 EAL domain-containing protein [Varunaivibrio sulfuroxidans]
MVSFSDVAADSAILAQAHDGALVALSYGVAVVASYTALSVSNAVWPTAGAFARAVWLMAGGFAMGSGIWAMHFVAMLSLNLGDDVGYDAGLTLVSLLPGVIAGTVALWFIGHGKRKYARPFQSGVVMGLGISAMHFVGLVAIDMQGNVHLSSLRLALSVVFSIGLSIVAMGIYQNTCVLIPKLNALGNEARKGMAALIMGAAMFAMHFVSMSGVTFVNAIGAPLPPESSSSMLLAISAAVVTLIIMGLAIVAAMVDRMVRDIRENRSRFQSLVDLSPNMICMVKNGKIAFTNSSGVRMLGAAAGEDLVGRPISAFVSVEYAAIFDAGDEGLDELSRIDETTPLVIYAPGGRRIEAELSVSVLNENKGRSFVLEFQDITALKRSAREVFERATHLYAIMENAAEGIVTLSGDGTIESANKAAGDIFGYYGDALEGMVFAQLLERPDQILEVGSYEVTARRRSGGAFPLEITLSEMRASSARRKIILMRDITRRKMEQLEVEFRANHDMVTELLNRPALIRTLGLMISEAAAAWRIENPGAPTAGSTQDRAHDGMASGGCVLFISLSGHARIHDTQGHALGEAVLREVGVRLKNNLNTSDIFGSWSEGQFVVLSPGRVKVEDVRALAARVHETLTPGFVLSGHEVNVGCHIGAAIFPKHGTDVQGLVQRASMAMFRGRHKREPVCTIFTKTMDIEEARRQRLENELRHALRRDQLSVHYQPKVDMHTGRLKGMEALVRWNHPEMGMISPVDFIPLAEETGMIVEIGAWVLETACAQTARWAAQGFRDLKVAVNLSGRQFEDPGLLGDITRVLERCALNPRRLEVEVTESSLMQDMDACIATLSALQKKGVSVAIDDFGTGYSSLAYLKNLPLNTLKIDQSFVRHIDDDAGDAAIATSVISIARSLNLAVVAEGIETDVHAEILRRMSCDMGQGYLYSKPLAAHDFEAFLHRENNAATRTIRIREVGETEPSASSDGGERRGDGKGKYSVH